MMDAYPLPAKEEELELIGNAKFLSTIDLAQGLYQMGGGRFGRS